MSRTASLRPSFAAIPPGALDLAGDAVRRRRVLQRDAMAALARANYDEVIPPTFEYEDIFLRAAGSGIAERLIRFPDRDGRILALRYDFTASVARIAATTFADTAPPLRLCYSGKVFRQEPERGGRPRETLQVGAELLGYGGHSDSPNNLDRGRDDLDTAKTNVDASHEHPNAARSAAREELDADIEIVQLALALTRAAGLEDFQLNLGHVGVLAPGLRTVGESLRDDLRRWIDRKDRGSLTRALAAAEGDARALLTLPFVIGRRDALEEALRTAPAAAAPGLEHLLALDAALTPAERAHLVYDLGEVRGLDYYTGIHFELFVAGAGRAAGAGGRYDDLMGRFGRPMPAVGVALDLDTIAEAAG